MKTKPHLHYYQISENVTSFSTTRHGGFSKGCYGELNVNRYCGDDPVAIAQNRAILCEELEIGQEDLLMPHQVHGTRIVQVTPALLKLSTSVRQQQFEGVDALMTDVRHICIGVSTADCIPIIIYSSTKHAACVVHAGWRGTLQRITENAVRQMVEVYSADPSGLKAVIGPGISLQNFEVGNEVYAQFAAAGFPMAQISRLQRDMSGGNVEKWHIDLWESNRLQLQTMGIPPENIQLAGICTYDHSDDFFSARRLGIASGRILTGIVLR